MAPESENQAQPKHDIFEDPAIARAFKEDPVFAYLSKSWKQLLVAVVAIVAVFYAKGQFQRTQKTALDDSAQIFSNVSSQYELFALASQEVFKKEREKPSDAQKAETYTKELDELKKKRDESARSMADLLTALGDTREPYSKLVPLYSALVKRITEGPEAFAASIGEPAWRESTGNDRLVLEIEALAKARALIDVEQRAAEARQELTALADNGAYVSAPAVSALAQTAKTAEERAAAKAAIERVIERQPEQRDVLEPELARLAG